MYGKYFFCILSCGYVRKINVKADVGVIGRKNLVLCGINSQELQPIEVRILYLYI